MSVWKLLLETAIHAPSPHNVQYFHTVISSYGASDLEINIGVETDLTINLRRLCMKDRELSQRLFRREMRR